MCDQTNDRRTAWNECRLKRISSFNAHWSNSRQRFNLRIISFHSSARAACL